MVIVIESKDGVPFVIQPDKNQAPEYLKRMVDRRDLSDITVANAMEEAGWELLNVVQTDPERVYRDKELWFRKD